MAAGIANPLRMGIFSIMNNEKAHDSLRADTKERGLVSILQMKNWNLHMVIMEELQTA